jgi:hypothetical protein
MDFIKYILFEGREDDFRFKYGDKFSQNEIESLIGITKKLPNGTKFLPFLGKSMNTGFSKDEEEQVLNLLKKFVAVGKNLEIKDINSYSSIDELKNGLKTYEEKIRRNVKQVEGADIVYEDRKYVIVTPKTYKASCYYGAGTKWCTASSATSSHYNDYMRDGRLFYIINKTKPTSDTLYKVALLQKFDGDQSFWDAPDKKFTTGWIFDTPEFTKIMLAIDTYMMDNFSEQLEIYKDVERRKKEQERVRAQEERERYIRLRQEAEERRQSNEWGEDVVSNDDEGGLAHALLTYLIDYQNVAAKTDEDSLRKTELMREKESLETEFDGIDDEDVRSTIEERIESIDEEINEINNKIDVYNLIPYGDYYDMKRFYVIDTDNFETTDIFAVGTEYQTQSSAEQYMRDLLDDVGIGGFNTGFVSNHIDSDKIKDYLSEFFNYDVWDNPDGYLDETEDRLLSDKQESWIYDLNEKIKRFFNKIQEVKDELDEIDMDEETEKYEELEQLISDIEDEIYETETEIEEIKGSPEGDWDEEKIEQVIEEKVDYYSDNPEDFVGEFYGSDYNQWIIENNLIDIDSLIEDAIESDGFGHTLNSNDGSADEINRNGETYYIMQIE